ncbi:AbrB family transcriptional regulator [Ancylobacter terrae]|uniref:AbrB family transcriptional regulator n=1 Tax=Ancylobacter sp. sgz301288 TaxID=3342077 RepID=UPI0038584417
MRATLQAVGALIIGGFGGLVFKYLHLPLPWTLGSLAAVGIAAIFGSRLLVPPQLRHAARPVVGVLAGSAFTVEIVAGMAQWWPILPTVLLYTLATAILGSIYFARVCRFDQATAVFASFPGGLGELTLLGGSLGGDVRKLALVHSARVITVVFCVPFIVRALAGDHVGTPTLPALTQHAAAITAGDWLILAACAAGGYLLRHIFSPLGGAMVAAMIFSAIAHGAGLTAAQPPQWLVGLVQVTIGAIVGSRLGGTTHSELGKTMLQGAAWAVVLISLAAVTAVVCGLFLDFDRPTLLLAMAPGGLVENTLLAYAMGLEIAFVVTTQLCRVVGTMVLAPVLFRVLGPKSPPSETQ